MELAYALQEYKMKEVGANGDGRSDGMNGSVDKEDKETSSRGSKHKK